MNDQRDESRRERVLRERAERLARVEAKDDRRLLFQAAVVQVGSELVGIPAAHLREIIRVPPLTPLPGLPEGIVGVVLVRGEILSVIELARWVGARGAVQRSCLVVLEGRGGLLGALADQSLGFRDVYADELASELVVATGGDEACVAHRTRDLCAILDVPKLFADPRLIVGGGRLGADAGGPAEQAPRARERGQ